MFTSAVTKAPLLFLILRSSISYDYEANVVYFKLVCIASGEEICAILRNDVDSMNVRLTYVCEGKGSLLILLHCWVTVTHSHEPRSRGAEKLPRDVKKTFSCTSLRFRSKIEHVCYSGFIPATCT